jgi:hypothetical protein
MTLNEESGLWETVQSFSPDNPRFKISRYQDWSEAYPAQDYPITEGPGSYYIAFDDQSTRVVSVEKIVLPAWNVSGSIQEDGVGLAGVSVSAGGKTVLSGSDGSYRIPDLQAGNYSVTAEKAGYVMNPGSQPITIISSDVSDIDFTAESSGNSLVVHYAEHQYAEYYILHAWDGLSGDFTMEYEGFFNDRHWWIVTIENAPASFKFCFNNSNNNWDGTNRSFDGQVSNIYTLPFQGEVLDFRP